MLRPGFRRAIEGDFALGANVNFVREGSWANEQLSNATRSLFSGAGVIRYPGGTNANVWDWRRGWCLQQYSGPSNACHGLPIVNYTLEDLKAGLDKLGRTRATFVLNVMTSTLDEQLAMLAHARALGIAIRDIELGNEVYWGKYSTWYPDGTAYGKAMAKWVDAIRKAGHVNATSYLTLQDSPGINEDSTLGRWNADVLAAYGAATGSRAGLGVVFHVYRGQDRRLDTSVGKGEWASEAIQQYSHAALGTTEGLDGYLGQPQWNSLHDPALLAPTLTGLPRLVSEMNVLEHAGGGLRLSWAHGLYIASSALSLWHFNSTNTVMIHTLSGMDAAFGWAALFSGTSQLAGACCGRSVPTEAWAPTAEGAAMAAMQQAAVGAKAITPLVSSAASPTEPALIAFSPKMYNPAKFGVNRTFEASRIQGVLFHRPAVGSGGGAQSPEQVSAILLNLCGSQAAVTLQSAVGPSTRYSVRELRAAVGRNPADFVYGRAALHDVVRPDPIIASAGGDVALTLPPRSLVVLLPRADA